MSSSPPPNQNAEFTQSNQKNPSQNQPHLLSSPTFRGNLNLQLNGIDTDVPLHIDENNNYTTNDVQIINHDSGSDTSIMYDTSQRVHDQNQVQQPYHQGRQQSFSQNPHQYASQDKYHYQQQNNPQYYSNYQQFSMSQRYNMNNPEYPDYVPLSSNADPNLQFPTSSSYMSLPSSSSFNNNQHIQPSSSSNSITNNLLSTPHQSSRRLSFTANLMSSVNTSNNRSPITSSATPVRPSMVTPKVAYTHRRSKSKINVDKSPANSGNPFYNPPSFISPKVTKKAHRKNISISNSINSISLSHLDTDLNLQNQFGRNGSPNETPLRTPGRYMYGKSVVYGEEYDEDDENDMIKNDENEDERMSASKEYIRYMKDQNESPNNTFVVPNVLMNNRFGGELIDTTATETETGQMDEPQSSILDPVAVNDINFLDDIFGDTAAVESLNDQMLFQFPSQTLEKSNSYFDTLEPLEQKQKFQPYESELPQTGLEPENDIPLPYIDNLNYNKSASVPQTRINSVSVDAKIQRSRSSFNLSSIASARDLKFQEQYGFQRTERLEPHLEASEPFQTEDHNESVSHTTSSSSLSSGHGLAKSGSLQEIAERGASAPSTSGRKSSASGVKTRSKSKSQPTAMPNIQHPEKLDLPQQSARSKSRTKKSGNEDKKVHECPLCHMKFQRPEHVKRHMLSHSSEKPFACPEPGCNKRFNRNDNLKQHLRNIHKKKI